MILVKENSNKNELKNKLKKVNTLEPNFQFKNKKGVIIKLGNSDIIL